MKKVLVLIFLSGMILFLKANRFDKSMVACNNDIMAGCYNVGLWYVEGNGVKQNYIKAMKYFNKACNGGVALGCVNIGAMYKNGRGVEQSYEKAKKYYKKACDNQEMMGCLDIGLVYKKENNYEEAMKYLNKACNGGEKQACINIGLMYQEGQGVKQNCSKARMIYKKNCSKDYMMACLLLGNSYVNCESGKDYAKAVIYLGRACKKEITESCILIGIVYEEGGNGVEQNYTKAKEFYRKSCKIGNQDGCKKLSYLNNKIKKTKQDIDINNVKHTSNTLEQSTGSAIDTIKISGEIDKKAKEYFNNKAKLSEIENLIRQYYQANEKYYFSRMELAKTGFLTKKEKEEITQDYNTKLNFETFYICNIVDSKDLLYLKKYKNYILKELLFEFDAISKEDKRPLIQQDGKVYFVYKNKKYFINNNNEIFIDKNNIPLNCLFIKRDNGKWKVYGTKNKKMFNLLVPLLKERNLYTQEYIDASKKYIDKLIEKYGKEKAEKKIKLLKQIKPALVVKMIEGMKDNQSDNNTTNTNASQENSNVSIDNNQKTDESFKQENTQLSIEDKIKSFLSDFYTTTQYDDIDKVLSFYSENPKRFFTLKNPTKEMIKQKQLKYTQKWPNREYSLSKIELLDDYTKDSKKYYIVKAYIQWKVSSDSKSVKGQSEHLILLVEEDGKFLIDSITAVAINRHSSCSVTGVHSYDTLSVRKRPTVHSTKIGELAPYASGIQKLRCIHKPHSSNWCKIRFYDEGVSHIGWVNSKFLYCSKPPSISYCVTGVPEYDTLNVRSKPYASSAKVGELYPDTENIRMTRCKMRSNGSKWCKIHFHSSSSIVTGWVNAKYLYPCGD